MSTNKQQNKGNRKGNKPRSEKESFKPKSEKEGFKPRPDKGGFKPKSEKGGFKSWAEKEGFKQRSDKGSSKPKFEKGGGKSWPDKEGFKSKPEKEGFKPRSEKGSLKSRPKKGGLKPWLDSEGLRPKPESGGLNQRTKPGKLKKRPGTPQKNRSENSPAKPGSVDQKDYLRDEIRLNKFISHSGFCSRREADEYISSGVVRVNGKVVTELGVKVKASDRVDVGKQRISLEPFVYILLNKGRDTISTTSDEKERNTVLDVVEDSTGHRVYPVGRLDRNTMGLILLTNDGDLAHRLMHPSYKVKKTYEVTSNPSLSDQELDQYRNGIVLEDGPVKAAQVKRLAGDPNTITISVFEGRNHLIRRMVEHFGAEVMKLKRVRYAGLTDKDLRVGRWRYLKQKEINDLRKLVKLGKLDFNKEET